MVPADENVLAQLLDEMRKEPTGWHPADLGKALDLAGFERKTIEDAKGWPVEFRYHPNYPDLNVVLYPVERAHAMVTQRTLSIIEELHRRKP